MAKTQYVEIPDELRNLERRAIERRDRFILGVSQGHKREPSKRQKRLLKRSAVINSPMVGRGSLFRYLSPFWRALTTSQKNTWRDAAFFSSLTNWQLFISDNAARIRNDLSIGPPPSELWQVRTGRLLIESPASELILKQEHPLDYYEARKVRGASWKRELVLIKEHFTLPLLLQLRYTADLTPVGGEQIARYYAKIWTSYQGQDIQTDFNIDISPNTDWTVGEITADNLRGILIGYTLYIEIKGYRGQILFDNIRAVHGGSNWARDPRCDDITKEFTKGFALVPPFWIPVSLPAGSSFSTVYPPAL